MAAKIKLVYEDGKGWYLTDGIRITGPEHIAPLPKFVISDPEISDEEFDTLPQAMVSKPQVVKWLISCVGYADQHLQGYTEEDLAKEEVMPTYYISIPAAGASTGSPSEV